MKTILKALIITAVVVLLIIGGVKAVKNKKAKEAALPPAKTYTIKVRTIEAKAGNILLTLPVITVVANDNGVKLSSKVAERVEEITKKRGERVKKGEVIVKLDHRDIDEKITALKSKIVSMRINLNNLKSIHKRSEELLKVEGVSPEQFEKEASSIASLEAQIVSLNANLSELYTLRGYTLLRSPIEGVVSKLFVSVGDMAMPGKTLIEIRSETGSYLVARVPSDIDAKAIIYKGREYPLTALKSTFNSLREYKTPLLNDNLIEGQRVDAKLILYKGEGVLLPNSLILNRDGKEYIVIADGNRAEAVEISPLVRGQEGVAVDAQGIADKDIVSAKPDILLKLLSGAPLEIIK